MGKTFGIEISSGCCQNTSCTGSPGSVYGDSVLLQCSRAALSCSSKDLGCSRWGKTFGIEISSGCCRTLAVQGPRAPCVETACSSNVLVLLFRVLQRI